MFSLPDGIMFEGDLDIKQERAVKKFIERYARDLLKMWETQEFMYLDPIE